MKRYASTLILVLSIAIFLNFTPSSRAEEFTCPVTKLVPITFEPAVLRNSAVQLLGTEKLFTIFPGNWQTAQRTDRGYRVPKLVWGTNVVDLHTEVGHSSLTLTGRRLDADSGPLVDWDTNTAWSDPLTRTGSSGRTPVDKVDKGEFFITSGFYVPARGCWEVTGHFHGADLKVVIDVK